MKKLYIIPVGKSMQRKNATIILALGLLLLSNLAGCRGTLPPEPPPEFLGQTVRVACPEEARDLVVLHSRAWAARQGARVEVSAQPAGALPADAADLLLF